MSPRHEIVLIMIYSSSFFIIGLVVFGLKVMPVFSSTWIFAAGAIFMFVFSENESMQTVFKPVFRSLHESAESENRFWTVTSFIAACGLFFARDSPLVSALGDHLSVCISWICVSVLTYAAHIHDRNKKRDDLIIERRVPMSPSVIEIERLLQGIDHPWISSTIANIFLLPRALFLEAQIINIFREADNEDLNQIILGSQLGLILYKVKDHYLARKFHRSEILNLLVKERLSHLNVASKATLLDALQRLSLTAHKNAEEYVKQIIVKTAEDDLSELKCLTDFKGDIHSMHKLIYTDIQSPFIRDDILKHIAHQAKVQFAHKEINSKKGKRRKLFEWRKIVSDIDDTLTCSFGPSLAGIDQSYPPKTIYPGVLRFYRELDLGIAGSDGEWDKDRVGNLVFLSARPHVYKDLAESKTFEKFKSLKCKDNGWRGMHTTPSLLAGSLETGSSFLFRGLMEPIAQKKFDNFREYSALYPEFKLVFIGDNGQGDVRAAEMILDSERHKEEHKKNLERIYIHQVQPLHKTFATYAESKSLSSQNICYFLTYVDAALDAYRKRFIRCTGLRRICQAAIEDFINIPNSKWYQCADKIPGQKEFRILELNLALRNANFVFADEGLDPVPLLRYDQKYPVGTPIGTAFGNGILTRFRSKDGMNEVIIPINISSPSIDMKTIKFHKLYTHNSVLKRLDPKKLPAGTISSILTAGKSLNLDRLRNLKSKFVVLQYEDLVGAIVWTQYGIGRISTYRKLDDKFSVTLQWNAIIYCNPSKVVRISDIPDVSNVKIPSIISTSVVNGGGVAFSTTGNIVVVSHQSSAVSR